MFNPELIPSELRALPQWVMWRMFTRGGDEPTKTPFQVNGNMASSDDPATWATFDAVLSALENESFAGIGFVFAAGGGMVGIDLDDCLEKGNPKPWCLPILTRFANTYMETSPSETGIKIWAQGTLPTDKTGGQSAVDEKRNPVKRDDPAAVGAIEMYHRSRFFTITTWRRDGALSVVSDCAATVTALWNKIKPKPLPPMKLHPSARIVGNVSAHDRMKRFQACADKRIGDSIQGKYGSNPMFHACCVAFRLGMDGSDARAAANWYNATKASPPWSESQIEHKLTDAEEAVRSAGEFGIMLAKHNGNGHHEPVDIAPPPEKSSELNDHVERVIRGEIVNVPWHYSPTLTEQGRCLLPGTVTVFCGRAGSTKSMFVSQEMLGWLENGVPFAVFHLEGDRVFHQHRMLAQLEGRSDLIDDKWLRGNGDEIRATMVKHKAVLDALGKRIWDAPESDVSLDDVLAWVQARADEKARVIIVDPITAADSGEKPWAADRRFILDAKRIMRKSGASLILVTHPRSGDKKADPIDNMAGGRAYNRFTDAVLWIEAFDDSQLTVMDMTAVGTLRQTVTINRVIKVSKARNGRGNGNRVGYYFNGASLCFKERGLVVEDDSK